MNTLQLAHWLAYVLLNSEHTNVIAHRQQDDPTWWQKLLAALNIQPGQDYRSELVLRSVSSGKESLYLLGILFLFCSATSCIHLALFCARLYARKANTEASQRLATAKATIAQARDMLIHGHERQELRSQLNALDLARCPTDPLAPQLLSAVNNALQLLAPLQRAPQSDTKFTWDVLRFVPRSLRAELLRRGFIKPVPRSIPAEVNVGMLRAELRAFVKSFTDAATPFGLQQAHVNSSLHALLKNYLRLEHFFDITEAERDKLCQVCNRRSTKKNCAQCGAPGHATEDCSRCADCKKRAPRPCMPSCRLQVRPGPGARHPGKGMAMPPAVRDGAE